MVTVAQMLRKCEPILGNPIEMLAEAIEETREEALNLNRIQLFQRGEKADGTRLAPYKSPAYAKKKHARNPLPGYGVPDAYDTGEMQKEMFLDVQGDKAVFDSVSPHATFMIKRDGPAVFGLTEDSKEKYRPIVIPAMLRKIKRLTGLQ